MKPLLRKISLQSDSSFSVQHHKAAQFYNYWHFHPEIELVLVQEGTGTRLVGDSVELFKKGDLILIGSNLPHLIRAENAGELSAVVIHVMEDFAGKEFIQMPEMKSIKDLFYKAQRGIIFEGATKELVSDMLIPILQQKGIERLMTFLHIFKTLSESSDIRFLSKLGSNSFNYPIDTTRINEVYTHVLSHFSENLTIENMARIANLSPTSFCRYFKKCTNKTFVDFLTEVRIGYACKQLIETDKTVGQISLEAGYNSISNFNSLFKKATKVAPLVYQKYYKG
jgi:AraC-like DNA-binding protein/mannose-6-phosphate isomerase-like protein (cupin superfamily)